jgi:TusA-related sulfurtransferase
MKVGQLKEVAEYFAVDLESAKTKNEIMAALEEEGVTFEMYAKFTEAETETIDVPEKKAKKVASGDTVLVKMDRENARFEINGFTFTREHPFVAMSEEDADFIFSIEEGFRMATPREVQEYYN